MSRKIRTCMDCNSHVVNHTVLRHSRFHVTETTTFACGSTQEETFNSESCIGSVEFNGSDCAA